MDLRNKPTKIKIGKDGKYSPANLKRLLAWYDSMPYESHSQTPAICQSCWRHDCDKSKRQSRQLCYSLLRDPITEQELAKVTVFERKDTKYLGKKLQDSAALIEWRNYKNETGMHTYQEVVRCDLKDFHSFEWDQLCKLPWTERQQQVLFYWKNDQKTEKWIADKLQITVSGIQKHKLAIRIKLMKIYGLTPERIDELHEKYKWLSTATYGGEPRKGVVNDSA